LRRTPRLAGFFCAFGRDRGRRRDWASTLGIKRGCSRLKTRASTARVERDLTHGHVKPTEARSRWPHRNHARNGSPARAVHAGSVDHFYVGGLTYIVHLYILTL